jgi:8-oxo-dGTP pyrophosphatase MutT (NUDIX family)
MCCRLLQDGEQEARHHPRIIDVAMTEPKPASTVVLVRRAPARLEVFLVRRHDQVAFMGGAHVFPGGRVDPSDASDDPEAWCDGVTVARTRTRGCDASAAVAFHVAAIRELFEEAGVLLARNRSGGILAVREDDAPRFDAARRDLLAGRLSLRALVEREKLRLALDALALFAQWVTPAVELRRFDTCFFLALAPEAQQAAHDDGETTHGVWIAPDDAIDRCLHGDIALPPPTWTTLRALSRLESVEEAWEWAQAQNVPRVQPCFRERADGTRVVMLPGDPECPPVEGFAAEETRFLLANGRWRPIDPSRS